MTRPPRRPSIRPSLVDIGWEQVPSVVPHDTVVGGSTESNELTAPIRPSAPHPPSTASEYSEPTGNIDDLLDEPSDSGLGLPPISSRRLPAPPSVPQFSAATPRSAPPPPPSSRRPPAPSSRPRPPSIRPPGAFGATLPIANPPRRPMPTPPPMPPPRVSAPRPHLPSGGPLQEFPTELADLRADDTVLTDFARPAPIEYDAPPSSGTPSSRLPPGIVIPNTALGPPPLEYARPAPVAPVEPPAPPSARRAAAEATQPAARLRVPPIPQTIPSVAPASSSEPALPGLTDALARRIRLGKLVLPLGVPVAAASFALAVAFGLLMALITSMTARDTPAAVPVASAAPPSDDSAPSAPVTELPEPSPPKGTTPVERAADGDEGALKELAAKPASQRSIAESMAIYVGQVELRKRELAALGKQAKDPKFGEDRDRIRKLLEFVRDEDTSRPALELIARLDSPLGPDLLYHVWTSTRRRNSATELAEALVFSKEVRPRASPALAVALDLRSTEACEPMKQVVERAIEHGDRRSLASLAKLSSKRGCGPKKTADCYPCLRDGDALKDAAKEARKRAPPRF